MRKYKVYFLREEKVVSAEVEAASFTAITVSSRVASTTVEFYDAYGKNLFMFANAVNVEYKGEAK